MQARRITAVNYRPGYRNPHTSQCYHRSALTNASAVSARVTVTLKDSRRAAALTGTKQMVQYRIRGWEGANPHKSP